MKSYKLKSGQNMIIRGALVEDAKKLIEYVNKAAGESDFLAFGAGEINITLEREQALIEEYAKADNKLLIIAEIDGSIVGNLHFEGGEMPRTRHTGELGVSVLKDYWALGIGTELIRYLVDWANVTGIIRKINLRVRSDNENAIKLYNKLGFVDQGVIPRDFLVDGMFYSSIMMGLEID